MKKYRDNGAIGALLDEYERAIEDLQAVLAPISNQALVTIVDTKTTDPDCISIQTILAHVVKAGYNYAIAIRNNLGETLGYRQAIPLKSVAAYQEELKQMFTYNEQLFEDYPTIVLAEHSSQKKILVSWGQRYDVEQLMEHAIVHILRHRRQIERFKIKMSV